MKDTRELQLLSRVKALIVKLSEQSEERHSPSINRLLALIDEGFQEGQLTDAQYAAFQAFEREVLSVSGGWRMNPKLKAIKNAATAALASAKDMAHELCPGGTIKGQEYIVCNPLRGDSRPSLSINLVNGKANDFASPDHHYGDLVALSADIWGMNQYQAALRILEQLGFAEPGQAISPRNQAHLEQRRREAEQKRRDDERDRLARERYVMGTLAPKLWRQAVPESSFAGDPHPYLVAKQIEAHNSRRLKALNGQGWDLLIPVCDHGQLVNLQIINPNNPDSPKRFIKGGRVTGCYAPLGSVTAQKTLYICEGWATGATLLEYYGGGVACTLFAANLEPVARKLREHYGPDQNIVIAGDDDRANLENAGRKAATEAAHAIDADLVFPEFRQDAPAHLSDFNDLHVYELERLQGVSHG